MLKNNGREFKKRCMIPLKSSLKRNYRCFQKIVAPSQLAQPEQPKGGAACCGSLCWMYQYTVTGSMDSGSTVRQKNVTEATYPTTDKKQREKDKALDKVQSLRTHSQWHISST